MKKLALARPFQTLAAALLLAAAAAHADPVVYSQPYNPAEDTTWDSYVTPSGAAATVYDHFKLTAAEGVTAVQWQGDYLDHNNLANNPTPPDATAFVVSFYADNGGQPGALLATATLPVAACAQTSLGTVPFNAFNDPVTHQISFFSYRAALPTPFAAAAGQTYWLSVAARTGAETPIWGWYASTADGSTTCFQDFAGNRITRAHSRAFALEGVAPAAAPGVTVAATTPTAQYPSAPGVFTLTLSAPAAADIKVAYTLKGSAVNGTDYQLLKGTAKVKAGKASKAIQVVPLAVNGTVRKSAVKLTLAPGAGYTVGTPGAVKIKIAGGN